MLFKPDEVVYAKHQDADGKSKWMPYIATSIYTRDNSTLIDCWNIAYYGGQPRRVQSTFCVPEFNGECAVLDLSVIPASLYPEDLDLQRGLPIAEFQTQLGKEYWHLMSRPVHKEWRPTSPAVDSHYRKDMICGSRQAERVIVDLRGYYEAYPLDNSAQDTRFTSGRPRKRSNSVPSSEETPATTMPSLCKDLLPQLGAHCTCDTCKKAETNLGVFAGFDQCNPATNTRPKNDLYYLLCITDVPVFQLSSRTYRFVDQTELDEVHYDHEAFDRLVLDHDIKRTVRALAEKFANSDGGENTPSGLMSPWSYDILKNKGGGRVFLLHGSHGVGKTCTAECIAELAQWPLLMVTASDICSTTDASSVERRLNDYLDLGERYGALMLLDEADIFLEERQNVNDYRLNTQRNALVSVFLRALDRFRGVLFLTTTRVDNFDPAFISRIHVALHYRPLTAELRRRIWEYHFTRLEKDTCGRIFTMRSAREFAYDSKEMHRLRLNGREIRNVLQTAVALAESDARSRPFIHYTESASNGGGDESMDGCGTMADGNENASAMATVQVTESHLRAVAKMSRGFKDFIRNGCVESDESEEDE